MTSANPHRPRIAAILMECNPLHEGHRYVLQEARRRTGADAVVVLLSGDFVQRGIPAIESKELRTRQLLACGADLVLELPAVYAASSAEYFARGGMEIFSRLGLVTDLVFGSESGSLDALLTQAQFLADEPADFQVLLRKLLADGLSYPAARVKAAASCHTPVCLSETSNDILAVEYLKALLQMPKGTQSAILSTPQDRQPASLCGMQIHAVPRISAVSASTLREQRRQREDGIFANDFSDILLARLLDIMHDPERSYADYAGVSRDLSNRMERFLPEFVSWSQFCATLKTRNITYSAISRALLHLMLGITKEYEQFQVPSYVRVLGCRKDARFLIGRMQSNGLTVFPQLPKDPCRQLLVDIRASELYDYICRRKPVAAAQSLSNEPEEVNVPETANERKTVNAQEAANERKITNVQGAVKAPKKTPPTGFPAERISEYTKSLIVVDES